MACFDKPHRKLNSRKTCAILNVLGRRGRLRQWPGRTITFGVAGIVAFETTSDGTSRISTGHSLPIRARNRSSVTLPK
jgi:hypothetical protein